MGVDFLLLRSMYAIKADLRLLVFFGVIVQLLGCATDLEEKKVSNSQSTAPLFTLLPAAQTKIDFQNTLTEGLNTNILMYEYFYNGGGVAVGDFNGDGLEDLYFTANMEDNKMYLNKGNLRPGSQQLISMEIICSICIYVIQGLCRRQKEPTNFLSIKEIM